jgi:hypothetical protein
LIDDVWLPIMGVGGWSLTVAILMGDVHPAELLAVTLYDPGTTPVKIPLVFV